MAKEARCTPESQEGLKQYGHGYGGCPMRHASRPESQEGLKHLSQQPIPIPLIRLYLESQEGLKRYLLIYRKHVF